MRILANTALWRLQERGSTLSKRLHIQKRLDEISLRLIEGQYLDISFENRFDITANDYLTMIESKTAALISGSMEIGAFIGSENEPAVRSFGQIGKYLGLAFQIRDDILGIWGNAGETGKTTGGDIRRRKKSFPVVYAMENSNGSMKKALISIYQSGPIDENAVNKVMEILEVVGARIRPNRC
jgi:geranylgeranyl diphosphate synthase type I